MAEFVTRHSDVPFKNSHPSKTSGKKFSGKDLPPHAGSDGLESNFKSCKQCGFIFDTTKHGTGDGWGGNITTSSISGADYQDDETVGAGCPFCGASNY